MKYKTLFRLLLKAIGVYLFATGAARALMQSAGFLYRWGNEGFGGNPWQYAFFVLSGGFLEVGFGLYLFFGGRWIVDKAIPGNRPYCHECGYDLTGATRNRCPECDTAFRPEDVRPPEGSAPVDDAESADNAG